MIVQRRSTWTIQAEIQRFELRLPYFAAFPPRRACLYMQYYLGNERPYGFVFHTFLPCCLKSLHSSELSKNQSLHVLYSWYSRKRFGNEVSFWCKFLKKTNVFGGEKCKKVSYSEIDGQNLNNFFPVGIFTASAAVWNRYTLKSIMSHDWNGW